MIEGHYCHISALSTHDHGIDTPTGVSLNTKFELFFRDKAGVLEASNPGVGTNDPWVCR